MKTRRASSTLLPTKGPAKFPSELALWRWTLLGWSEMLHSTFRLRSPPICFKNPDVAFPKGTFLRDWECLVRRVGSPYSFLAPVFTLLFIISSFVLVDLKWEMVERRIFIWNLILDWLKKSLQKLFVYQTICWYSECMAVYERFFQYSSLTKAWQISLIGR